MAVHNQWQVTLDCLNSILRRYNSKGSVQIDRDDLDLMLVDNASTEPMPAAIQALVDGGTLRVIRNSENLYCARAWNQIWRAAKPGQHVIIVNNDIEVTAGFLEELHQTALWFRPSIATTHVMGVAKPEQLKPVIPGVTQIIPPGFRHLNGIVFSGLQETFDMVGGFDEAYQTPWFEDDDFWMACHKSRVPLLIAPVTVYHRGAVTCRAVSFDRQANHRYFYEKWAEALGEEARRELAIYEQSA